jgi:hypothetical protein
LLKNKATSETQFGLFFQGGNESSGGVARGVRRHAALQPKVDSIVSWSPGKQRIVSRPS